MEKSAQRQNSKMDKLCLCIINTIVNLLLIGAVVLLVIGLVGDKWYEGKVTKSSFVCGFRTGVGESLLATHEMKFRDNILRGCEKFDRIKVNTVFNYTTSLPFSRWSTTNNALRAVIVLLGVGTGLVCACLLYNVLVFSCGGCSCTDIDTTGWTRVVIYALATFVVFVGLMVFVGERSMWNPETEFDDVRSICNSVTNDAVTDFCDFITKPTYSEYRTLNSMLYEPNNYSDKRPSTHFHYALGGVLLMIAVTFLVFCQKKCCTCGQRRQRG